MPTPTKPESIYERILREARERRERQPEHLAQQLQRIATRARTHGSQG